MTPGTASINMDVKLSLNTLNSTWKAASKTRGGINIPSMSSGVISIFTGDWLVTKSPAITRATVYGILNLCATTATIVTRTSNSIMSVSLSKKCSRLLIFYTLC
jgi:hypothetical protein